VISITLVVLEPNNDELAIEMLYRHESVGYYIKISSSTDLYVIPWVPVIVVIVLLLFICFELAQGFVRDFYNNTS
jgi:hypothetical protein